MFFLLTLIPVTIYISRKKESIVKGGSKFLRRTSLIPKLVLFSSSTRLWRILLIILLFALLIASNAAVASIINNWDSSVKELNNFYDYFIYAIGYSELPKINNATILVATFHLAKVYDKSVVTASFIQLSNVSPKLLEGRWPSKAGEATVSITLAKDLNLKLGDEVLYSIGLKNYTFKVVGIAFIPLFYLYTRETESIILNYDDYAKIFGRSEAFAIYLKGNVEQVLNELKSKGFSTYYRTKDESIKIASEGGRIALIFLNFLTITLTLSSALLISIIIFSELYSRSKEYAVFILIGYRIKEILFLIAFSVLILAIISLPISYFMLIFLSILLKNQIIAFTGYFDISINFIDILINLQYIILPILIVFIANYRYLKRLNIYKILLQ
jgi:ABC-type antimicrobial peptide transport system permease subunit